MTPAGPGTAGHPAAVQRLSVPPAAGLGLPRTAPVTGHLPAAAPAPVAMPVARPAPAGPPGATSARPAAGPAPAVQRAPGAASAAPPRPTPPPRPAPPPAAVQRSGGPPVVARTASPETESTDPLRLTEFQLDQLSHQLIGRVARLLRTELRLDRERIGRLRDSRP